MVAIVQEPIAITGESNAARAGMEATTDVQWDAFVANQSVPHFLQSSAWATLKSRFGWEATRILVLAADGRDGAPVGGASILLRRAAGISLAYVPRGPVVDWHDQAAVHAVIAAAADEARRKRASVLMVEPEVADSPTARNLLYEVGLRPSPNTIQPPSTIMLDIRGDEDAVLARMKSKWRYNIRLAERKDVTVRELARDELPSFCRLMKETAVRDRFFVHSDNYYAAAYDLFAGHTGAFLLAEYAGQPLGALVVLRCGPVAWYVWGASSSDERSRMPNYALQWAAIRWAREQGCTRYDLWGIPDDIGRVATGLAHGSGAGTPVDAIPVDLDALPAHDLWGVYRFKQGFGGEVVRHVGTWEMALQPAGYRLFQMGRALQGKVRAARQNRRARGHRASWQPVVDRATWQEALAALPSPHVLQGWDWGMVKAQTGWRATRYVLRDQGGQPVAALQFLDRQLLPFVPIRIGYVPKGPVLDWQNGRRVEAGLVQIEELARRFQCIFVKIDPDVDESSPTGVRVRNIFRQRGWRFSREQIQFKNTAISDLSPDEITLLEGMKSKWRYNIRLAQRRGITVRQGDEDDLAAFYRLYAETGARDGFLIRPFAYYRKTWATYLAAERDGANAAGGALLLAEHAAEREPLAGIFVLRHGNTAWYFYGASSERRRRDMPNYLLQWEGMRWARDHGCTRYDWWGAPTNLDDPADRMQGVWQFKQGFGAEFAPHVGAWDYATLPWLYQLYTEAMPRLLRLVRRVRGIDSQSNAHSA